MHKLHVRSAGYPAYFSHLPAAYPLTNVFKVWLFLLSLFACQQLVAQGITDTVYNLSQRDTTSWAYKMETSGERWFRESSKKSYQIFTRYQQTPKNRVNANMSYYGAATLLWLNGMKEIEFAAAGITPQNADDFIYHVVENDSIEIVPWTKPKEFRTNKKLTYAYLGKFNTDKRMLKLELYNINAYNDRAVLICNGLYMPTAKAHGLRLNYTNQYLFKPHMQHYIPHNKQKYYQEEDWKTGNLSFKWSDSINHLAIEIEPTLQNDMYSVYLKRVVNGKVDSVYISNNWELSYYGKDPLLRINASFFNKPGSYEIIVVPEAPDDFKKNSMSNAVYIPFKVLESDTTLFTFRQMIVYTGMLLLAGILVFIFFYLRSKRKLSDEARQKEMANLQLNSVRSQLNPHFMFNALAGIQNLMNKNDVSAANRYLSKFARITRTVLDENHNEAISIAEETRFIEDYLQMEQLRFGFQYEISIDENINKSDTEIPSMLLQPFVENAVKHGVSALNSSGFVRVNVYKNNSSIVMEVADNGKGFAMQDHSDGKGIMLSKRRIELLNSLHHKNSILLDMRSGAEGTTIILRLENWL